MPLSGWVSSTPETKPSALLSLERRQQVMGRLGEEAPRGLGLRSVVEQVAGGHHEPLVVLIEPADLHERGG